MCSEAHRQEDNLGLNLQFNLQIKHVPVCLVNSLFSKAASRIPIEQNTKLNLVLQ